MPADNAEIAALFDRYADLLEIQDANPFRVRAYRNAARVVSGSPRSMAELLAEGRDLEELPGIGKDLAAKIATIVRTGALPQLEQLQQRVPRALSDLMGLPGLGPKRVKLLYRELNIRSIEDLQRAARSGALEKLPGFGAKTIARILGGIESRGSVPQRFKLADAEQAAAPLVAYLEKIRGVKTVTVAGSYRRRRDTVGDLDILVTARRGTPVMRRFTRYDAVAEVLSAGATRASVRLRNGMQVDLRLVPEASYGAALYYFTGSKAHNIAVRKIAVGKGLKINEYGVYRGARRIAGRSEAELFAAVNLPYVPPELRENRGEIETARNGKLPELVSLADLRGDLHAHTTASDGHDTLAAMAGAARTLGYAYLAITDHTRQVRVAHGLNARELRAHFAAIDRLNAGFRDFRLLKSAEVDILDDGSLDLPAALLAEMDVVVAAAHYHLALSAERQTARILKALDNRCVHVLAHPTTRLINQRPEFSADMQKIFAAAAERHVAMEINAQPERLDLDDIQARAACAAGCKLVISSDAHSAAGLANLRYGVDQARRAWLSKEDVLNTLPLDRLLQTFHH
ncbi:MAG: DNA polymerase/3'-5' exonuclease PolX [Gammaproteobacteria bacterium]|nr:DNA polymerase/3'-5' exonuclease PolX [Gammaproteobacteria bacterium]MBU6508739.1 DNA polymerase/3'-5' exonuclease PolX [Gammaproteobacteria bacterium]MDE1983045.1 DNA polymerase/3'-5' exonuclease PolX [Gammaproteobacteria bacterium]MDE2107630.1 DNA polymerase/3'-5' exonuclease PolX [Gammaproteobacteria bacterium]MDE2460929.1 DNA polymerase/3'-5' exonuclease PolX [Gammaproteobacteria bacterium]